MEFNKIGIDELPRVAAEIIAQAQHTNLVTFYGQMGAGKTTLIKTICAELGVDEEVSSPTFSLVNEYQTKTGKMVYHFDFYRIKSIEEVYDMGYEDYFYSNAICLIEWPEMIAELLDGEPQLQIHINPENEHTRQITITAIKG